MASIPMNSAVPSFYERVAPFDPEGTGYDFATAAEFNIRPDETGHWPSRAPNGQLLKGARHRTFHKTVAGEKQAGYQIQKGEDGKYYSQRSPQDATIKPLTTLEQLQYSPPLGDMRPITDTEWLVSQYTPDTKAVQHGIRQGAANALAIPQFLGDLFNAPNTFINNNLTDRPEQDYFRNFDAASQAYARDITNATPYEDFARTPGNVGGNLSLQVGTEMMLPLGGGYSAVRAPLLARRARQAAADVTAGSDYSQARRDFLGNTGKAAAAAAVPVVAIKAARKVEQLGAPAHVVDDVAQGVAPGGKWDSIVDEIYDADITKKQFDNYELLDGHAGNVDYLRETGMYTPEQLDDFQTIDKAVRRGDIDPFDTVRRPEESKFLRFKNDAAPAGRAVREFDNAYDMERMRQINPEEARAIERLWKEVDAPKPGQPTHVYIQMQQEAAWRQSMLRAKMEYNMLSPETKGKIFHRRQAELSNIEYAGKKLDRYDADVVGKRKWDDLSHYDQREFEANTYQDLVRADPNVSAYRRQRAKARAEAIGDDLWRGKRKQLSEAKAEADRALKDNPEMRELDEAGLSDSAVLSGDLARHMELGKRVGLVD